MSVSSLITPAETLNRLGISYSTFLRQVKTGSIPSVKIGTAIRVPESYFQSLENQAMENFKGAENEQ